MTQLVFAIWDGAAGAYSQPFFAVKNEVALRMFNSACSDKASNLFKYPEQFTLFRLGSFDDNLGTFENEKAPVPLAGAKEFKKDE